MYSTYFNSATQSGASLSAFYGINRRARISDGEFADMQNMSSDNFPLLSPRAPRMYLPGIPGENLNGIIGDVGFAAVWGTDLYYMGQKIEGLTLTDDEKNMLAFGAYILIYPDAVYYNTVNGEYGNIAEDDRTCEKSDFVLVGKSRFNIPDNTKLPCDLRYESGTVLSSVTFLGKSTLGGVSRAVNPTVLRGRPSVFSVTQFSTTAYDTGFSMLSTSGGYLYYCSSADITETYGSQYDSYTYKNCEWTKLEITDFNITAEEFAALGLTDADMNRIWAGNEHVQIEKNEDGAYAVKNEKIANVFRFDKVYIDSWACAAACVTAGQWKVRTTPVLDYVCVQDNRLWGCHYGTQISSFETVNEIYCSELGDFRKWETGTTADKAWTASVGAYGKWTGCISHRGYILFFKEDKIFRVSGTKPSNFQYAEISTSGLQAGCERSMAVIDEVLYYKSPNGVYAYDGSLPERISDKLADAQFAKTATAGASFDKYYICLDGTVYVYDTTNGLWHREDAAAVRFFARYGGALYGGVENTLICFFGQPADFFTGAVRETGLRWYAETGDIGLSAPNQKYFREFVLRMDAQAGSRLTVELMCDNSDWRFAADYSPECAARLQSVCLPIAVPRCDHMRIRLCGVGNIKIYSIAYTTEHASVLPERR